MGWSLAVFTECMYDLFLRCFLAEHVLIASVGSVVSKLSRRSFRGVKVSGIAWVKLRVGLKFLALGGLIFSVACQPGKVPSLPSARGNLSDMALAAPAGFNRADGSRQLSFPDDFGAHPDFQTEWWYYTGNLWDSQGRRFGYQLTFFRRALLSPQEIPKRASQWGTSQAFLAHFAITDARSGEHQVFERASRGSIGLAGAEPVPFRVWLEDWHVEEVAPKRYRLQAAAEADSGKEGQLEMIALELMLHDPKGPILHGNQGYSQKGPAAGNASYYFSQTRLISEGTLRIGNQNFNVQGTSWMDHEFSTSALSAGQVGWDWFSFQFDDGSELMVYQIRREEGGIDPFSSGTWIAPDGSTQHLEKADFEITPTVTWKSPQSGAVYPAGWVVRVPGLALDLEIDPVIADQELNLTYQYWEGSVDVRGTRDGKWISGVGYVELTGYGRSMRGEF